MLKNSLKKIGAWLVLGAGAISLLIGMVFGVNLARAAGNDTTIEAKINATSIIDCIEDGAFESPIELADMKNGLGDLDFMKGTYKVYVSPEIASAMNGGKQYSVGCKDYIKQLLINARAAGRIKEVPKASDGAEAVTDFMVNMGYDAEVTQNNDATVQNGQCFWFDYIMTYTYTFQGWSQSASDETRTQKICAKNISDSGVILSNEMTFIPGDSDIPAPVSFDTPTFGGPAVRSFISNTSLFGDEFKVGYTPGVTRWDDFKHDFEEQMKLQAGGFDTLNLCSAVSGVSQCTTFSAEIRLNSDGYVEPGTASYVDASRDATYTMNRTPESYQRIIKFLTGLNSSGKPKIIDREKFVLYQNYLVNFFGVEANCNWTDDEAATHGRNEYSKVKLFIGNSLDSGEVKTCYVKATKNKNKKVGGVDGNQYFGMNCNFKCVTDWLNGSSVNKPSVLPAQPNGTNAGGGSSSGGSTTSATDNGNIVDCDQFENVGAMQWVLCPTMNNSQYTANLLDQVTEAWMTIDTDIYGSGTTTADVWEVIRNIANVLLVAFFSVVIISQLTGYGIDNYGIKKMLPRIIVMAIIVNISLYICQIAIDLSNILGVGLRDLFGSIGNSFSDANGLSFIGGMIAAAFASAGGVSVGVGAGAAIFALGAPIVVGILIAVIVALLVIIVAIFVLFLMLGVRKIIVIVCVILSPLAFAAFILPNTQGLFKKWWDLFKAALIIFPICGLVSGISALLKGMAGDGMNIGVAGAIIMMVLPYAVFFLIPTLLKNAITALGKVGGALTALGQTVRNGGRQLGQTAWGAAQKSQKFRDLQQDAERARKLRVARTTMEKYGDGSDLQRRLADAQARANANPNSSAAQRRLERVQNEQRRFYDAQQSYYQLQSEQNVANTAPGVLAARAQSSQESLEYKNVMDQFANASTSDIERALDNAESAYSTDRSSANATRLRAMQSVALGKGMNSRVLNGLNGLALDDNNGNDQKVLNSINYDSLYDNLTRAELGNELVDSVTAYNGNRSDANARRLQNIIRAADKKNMDKEMLSSLGGLNMQAATVDANGAVRATNDARVLDTMSGVNNKVVKQFGTQMGKAANTQQNMNMNQFAASTGPVKLSEALAGKGTDYLKDTNDDTLEYIANSSMATGTYNPVLSSDALANIAANTNDEKVLRQARKMYNDMNADDINFNGNQLAKYDIETLRQITSRISPNSRLQRTFISATNDIAKNSELMSYLDNDKKAMFKAIRSRAGINDNLFDS